MPILEFIRMRSRLPALKSTAAGSSINWEICNSIFKINIKIYNSLIIVRNRWIIYKIIAQIIFITIFLFKKDKNQAFPRLRLSLDKANAKNEIIRCDLLDKN